MGRMFTSDPVVSTGYMLVGEVIMDMGAVLISGTDQRHHYATRIPFSPRYSPCALPKVGDVVSIDLDTAGGAVAVGVLITMDDIVTYNLGVGDVLIKGNRVIIAGEVEFIQ